VKSHPHSQTHQNVATGYTGSHDAALEANDVRKRFGAVAALDGATFSVPTGSLLALLGPSGCGKTTLLRVMAGFERPDNGSLRIAGRTIVDSTTNEPPERRSVGIVPQEGALFPHLNVRDNVGYGLPAGERRGARTMDMLELVGLAHYAERRPHQLSGGQQQRVALARCLAARPAVVLLDEPFAALDATLRSELRAETRNLLRQAGTTTVLVTHDQDEALSMADSVALMREGRIVQQATPGDLYAQPASSWAAQFVGDANLLPTLEVRVGRDREVLTPLGWLPIRLGDGNVDQQAPSIAMLRPEQLTLHPSPASLPGETDDPVAVVVDVVFHGHDHLVKLALEGGSHGLFRLAARAPAHQRFVPGQRVSVSVSGRALLLPSNLSDSPNF
jgi:iron(III) transport system ATP-binding protein